LGCSQSRWNYDPIWDERDDLAGSGDEVRPDVDRGARRQFGPRAHVASSSKGFHSTAEGSTPPNAYYDSSVARGIDSSFTRAL